MQNKNLQRKRALRTALLVLLFCTVGREKLSAQFFTEGDLNYSINDDGASVTVIGHVNGYGNVTGELVIPESVNHESDSYFVTSIGQYAFVDCSGLTSVSIGNSMTYIGTEAFRGCTGLTRVNITDLAGWCRISFDSDSSNPLSFAHHLYLNNCEVTNLIIPNSVTSIKDYAFYRCEGLTTVSFPNTVTAIGDYAFANCYGLNDSLTIPNSIISIGNCSFQECSGLVGSLNIPNSVTYIGERAFLGCYGFTGSLALSNSLISISSAAFAYCTGFTGSLIIPNSVTTIGEWAFGECHHFTNLILSNSTISIGDFAFRAWMGLSGSITIPNSVTMIGDRVFENCFYLETVVALCTIPPTLGYLPFYCPNLIVCCGCMEAYESSDWANYFTTIEEDCTFHNVNLDEGNMSGGSVSTSVNSTNMGTEVQIIVTPDDGMELVSLIVSNANNPEQMVPVYPIGKASSIYGFIMPPFDVMITATFNPTTTISEDTEALVSVYPNPTNGQIKIEAEDLKHITISNMLGQTIINCNASGNAFEYDFSKHNAGIYLIRIETANGVAVKKVSVTR